VSEADEEAHVNRPGTAVVPLVRTGPDEWADLRPAVRWLQDRRPVALVAILAIIAQAVWLAQFLSGLYFSHDDFVNLDLARQSSLSWGYLTYIGPDHLMIGERVIDWLAVRISFYNWGLASAVTVALAVAAGLAAFALLRTLFGERPAILIPLVGYLAMPLSVAALGWWTEAIAVIPLELAMFMALNAHVRYVRTERRRSLVAAVAWVAVGLLFFEKALILPLLLFGVTSAYLVGGGSWLSAMRRCLVRYRRIWLLYGAVLAVYLVVLLTSLGTASTGPALPASAGAAATFSWGLIKDTLLPGVIGGPWRWYPLASGWYALAAAPAALEWLAVVAAVAFAGATIWRRPTAWRGWALLAGWVVLADIAPVLITVVGRYPALLALDTRHVADAVPVLVICAGLACLPTTAGAGAGDAFGEPATAPRPAQARAGGDQVLRSAVAALAAVFALGCVWSDHAYESATSGSAAASYIANARTAIALVPAGTPVADAPVPAGIAYLAKASSVIGDADSGKLRWLARPAGTVDGLRMFGPDGRLYPAWVYGAASGPSPTRRSCWPASNGTIAVPFLTAAPYLTTELRIGYLWNSPAAAVIEVSYGPSVRRLTVRPGLHSGFVPVTGSASGVTVSGFGAGQLCIGDVEAGNPGPALRGPALPAAP